MIRIYCSKADATLQETETLTAGMVNTPVVQFTFSSDWDGLGKSAIVRAGTVIKEVVVSNNQIVVPSECLAKAGVNLIIGVWGGNFTTELPTVWCACGEIQDATNPNSALNHEEGTASNVAQMLAAAERAEAALDQIENANWDDVAQKVGAEKVNKPTSSPNGIAGQILQTNGNGTTQWVDQVRPTDEQVDTAVNSWLDDHPEATTTVQDGSLTEAKFANMDNLQTKSKQLIPAINEAISKHKVAALAHRGYTKSCTYARDNSATSFVAAFQNGFVGFECDPRKDINGTIVVLHNDTVDSVSNSTGKISSLAYDSVNYVSQIGVTTSTKLTTLSQAVAIAKLYHGFIMFDMSKHVVSVAEVVEVCEESAFYDYGFFNVRTQDELATAPEYAIKVWGNDVFTHTQNELDGYLSYGTKNNAIRLLITGLTEEQVNLAKTNGFKIMFNYTNDDIRTNVNSALLNEVDFILGDFIPYFLKQDIYASAGVLSTSVSLDSAIANLQINSIISFQIQTDHPDNNTGLNLQCIAFKQGSDNYFEVIGFPLNSNRSIFKRIKWSGTWSEWKLLNPGPMPYEAESVTLAITASGFITSGAKMIKLLVKLPRSNANVSNVSVTSLVGPIRVYNGGYVLGQPNYDWLANEDITITAALKKSSNELDLRITFPSTITYGGYATDPNMQNAPNNCLVHADFENLSLTFS